MSLTNRLLAGRALRRAAALLTVATAAAAPSAAGAQAYGYPSFQAPQVVTREYNFGLAAVGNGGGTALIFQWREGTSAKNQLSLDGGFASPDNSNGVFFVGGQFAHQITTATATMPFDLLLTAGANGAFGDGASLFTVPVGVSVGHRFPLDQGMSITPYVHPRITFSALSCDGCTGDNSNVDINFDVGGSFQINPQFAVRASAGFGGNRLYGDTFGVSLAWTPPGLARR